MTELEQARAWLKDSQERLHYERTSQSDRDRMRFFERTVLAALSWVWDAQDRVRINLKADAWFDSLGFDPATVLISTASGDEIDRAMGVK